MDTIAHRLLLLISVSLFLSALVMSRSALLIVGGEDADYGSIQAAIDAAHAGDAIEVQNGTYYENIVVDKALVLRGIDHPVVDAGGEYARGPAIRLTADNVVLEGFVATNSTNMAGDPYAGAGIEVRSSNNLIINNTILNNYRSGIKLFDCGNNTIRQNSISKNFEGIYVYQSRFNNISNNKIIDNSGNGIYLRLDSENNSIDSNDINRNFNGVLIMASGNNTITGNTFVENYGDSIQVWDDLKENTIDGNDILEKGTAG
ncbi:MAG: DUF1565 domain-containing protein [Methanosarcinales archaeon]|nr:DUF1565 domain-containing protein [Methanosarcinales archaeon]